VFYLNKDKMSVLTLELNNDADLELLNASIVEITEGSSERSEHPISWLERLAQKGGVKAISNPTEWQRETRTERNLPNRD
jgi:hypothetical protein